MALKPEVSLSVAAATGAIVFTIFQHELPSMADVRAADPHNPHITQSTNVAGWTAAAVVAGISLLAKDPTVFVVGGTMAAFLTWRAKHANFTSPVTGQIVPPQPVPGPAGPVA